MTTPSTSRLNPGPDDLLACTFTQLCRRGSQEYNMSYATERALRDLCMTPLFKHPKVFMVPVKREQQNSDGSFLQAWFPWQVCTNCIAGRAKGRCSLWYTSLHINTPMRVHHLMPGQVSDDDYSYGWFTNDVRDAFLSKDLGFYELWQCRDGKMRPSVRLSISILISSY